MKFKMGDWRTNCSLLGLMNILDEFFIDYEEIDGSSIDIAAESLEGFEEKYFQYFIERYEEDLPWKRIVSSEAKISEYLELKTEDFTREYVEEINKAIKLIKDYMTRNNYIKIYDLIEEGTDILEKVKNLKNIRIRKKDKVTDLKEEIESELEKLEEIITWVKKDKARKYMGAKGVIYSHIGRGMGGISFLNPTNREPDIYKEYRNYFIEPLLEYEAEDKSKYKYECFSCESKIKNLNITMNVLNQTTFDEMRKPSYAWNHISDVAICPRCLFLYTCLPAGFNYSVNDGIFLNYNYDLDGLKSINRRVKDNIDGLPGFQNAISYRVMLDTIRNQHRRHLDHEIRELQIVRLREDRYQFNILSRNVLEILNSSSEDLNKIVKASWSENKNYFSLYDLVVYKILNGENLWNLISNCLFSLISNRSGLSIYYNITHINRIININGRIIEGAESMSKENIRELIEDSRRQGYFLLKDYQEAMKNKERVANRMRSISYKMLNALKTNNSEDFMDTLLNSYMYVQKPVPMEITQALEGGDKLTTIGYSFVAGLNSYVGGEDKDEK